jgi:hypothetical protein
MSSAAGNRVHQTEAREIAALDQMPQYRTLLVLAQRQRLCQHLDRGRHVAFDRVSGRALNLADPGVEPGAVERCRHRVAHLQEERLVVGGLRLVGEERVDLLALVGAPADMLPGAAAVAGHAVEAGEEAGEGFDADRAEADFAVRDEEAGFDDVADAPARDLRPKLWEHGLDVEPVLGDFGADDLHPAMPVGHMAEDREDGFGDLQIVDPRIAAGEERAGAAVERAHHALGRLGREPVIDIAGEQLRRVRLHPAHVGHRDAGMGADLRQGQVLRLEATVAVERERLPILGEVELPCVGDVILFRPGLPLDLGGHLGNRTSFFHDLLLGSGIAPKAATPADWGGINSERLGKLSYRWWRLVIFQVDITDSHEMAADTQPDNLRTEASTERVNARVASSASRAVLARPKRSRSAPEQAHAAARSEAA